MMSTNVVDMGIVKVRLPTIRPYKWDNQKRCVTIKLGYYSDTKSIVDPGFEISDYRTSTVMFWDNTASVTNLSDELDKNVRQNLAHLKIKGQRFILTDAKEEYVSMRRLEIRYNRDPSEETWILRSNQALYTCEMQSLTDKNLVTTTQITVTDDDNPYIIERIFSQKGDSLGILRLTSTSKWTPKW